MISQIIRLLGLLTSAVPLIIDWYKTKPYRDVIDLHEAEKKQKDRLPDNRDTLHGFFNRLRKK